jgi:hypothetical protein
MREKMLTLKPAVRQGLIISDSVQRFVGEFNTNLGLRKAFFCSIKDALKGIGDPELSRLENVVTITNFISRPTQFLRTMNTATNKQRKHSPLHKFLEDYQIICNAMKEHLLDETMNSMIKLGTKTQTVTKIFISLCPNACYFTLSPKPLKNCKICRRKNTIFTFYCIEKDIVKAWKENALFEAWVYSLLKRNQIRCKPNMTIFVDDIDVGEIDLFSKKFIIEVKTGGSAIEATHKLLGKNALLGGGRKLVLVYLESIRDSIKKILEDAGVVVLDNVISDKNFDEKLCWHLKTS